MKIHDNGWVMEEGEFWWVSFMTYGKAEPQIRLAKVVGERPYQGLLITSEYPSDVWVIKRCNEYPQVEELILDGEKRLVSHVMAERLRAAAGVDAPKRTVDGVPAFESAPNPPTGGQTAAAAT